MSDAQSSLTLYPQPLKEARVRAQIQHAADTSQSLNFASLVESVEVLQSVNSTNSYLLNKGVTIGRAKVCAAEAQLSGRGRRGNDWQSAPNKNIMLSLSWGFKQWPDAITALGLAVGLVVAERLNNEYKTDVGIKWPNDLLVQGDKLAGVLVDVAGDANGACNVVIGLGLNVHQPDWNTDSTDYAWTDLYSQGVTLDRNDLIADIVCDWLIMLMDFERNGFTPMIDRWNALSSYTNRQVVIGEKGKNQMLTGRMIGVDSVGALLLESNDGEQHVVNNSQLSLRLAG